MVGITAFVLASSLASLSIAAPTINGKAAFSVFQVPTDKKQKAAPAVVIKRTYEKFNKPAPSAVQQAAAQQTGVVTAYNAPYDVEYVCPVTVGDQIINLDFDTGSSDLWVFSEFMPASQQVGHTSYVPSNSAVLLPGESFSISYGDGSGASGIVYADTVVVGGVTATAQAVEAATSASKAFIGDTSNSGLLGLAFSELNTVSPVQQQTFFDTVKPTLASALFTAALKHDAPGSYDFGWIDQTKYKGPIRYVPVETESGFWQFAAGNFSVGPTQYSTEIGTAIADTGTTLLYLPDEVVSTYYSHISGAQNSASQGGWIFPCSSQLLPLKINLGGGYYSVPASYLSFAAVSNTMCFGALQSDAGIGFSIFGDTFLKNAFVVFDQTQESPRLGFAKQAGTGNGSKGAHKKKGHAQ